MNKKLITGIVAVFVISIVSLVVAMAYKGNPSVQGPNYNAEVHTQLQAAIDANDYDAWIQIRKDNNLPMNGRMFQVINKDNFAKFAQMHNAMISGDTETANSIKAELGLGQGLKQGTGSKMNGQKMSGGCQMHSQSTTKTGCGMHSQNTGTCQAVHSGSCPMQQ